jgi:hypothetical protein
MSRPYDIDHSKSAGHMHPHLSILLLGFSLLSLLLLSACGSSNISNANMPNPATALSLPTIDPALQNQGNVQLASFQQWITLMQQYHGDTTTYQQQYATDQRLLSNARTKATYQAALAILQSQVDAIKLPAMKAEASYLQQQLQQAVANWGKTHTYYDDYNNTTYPLGYEYGPNGIGGWIQSELQASQTIADYQQAIEDINMYLTNFQAMMTNSSDNTPYNQVHATDLQLMQHYGKMNGKVVVISLEEQAVRVYDAGKLVNAFLATTGRPDRPSIPGVWWVEGKQSPTVFKSGVPPSSPDWYPDTPINYAMQYHSDGYFIHDSWWRADYGPGTNFPHADASGDPFSAQGSHGCINLAKANAGWLYSFVTLYTPIIIY